MFANRNREIGELVRRRGIATAARVTSLAAEALSTGRTLAEHLDATEVLPRAQLLAVVADELGCPLVESPPLRLAAGVVALVPPTLARRHGVVPYGDAADGALELLLLDPFEMPDLGELEFALGRKVRLHVADPEIVAVLLREHFGAAVEGLADALGGCVASAMEARTDAEAELLALAVQAPVVRYVDDVLAQAVRERASDIHFEPFERECRVRCRIDGALRE